MKPFLTVLSLWMAGSVLLQAQPVLTPRNIALGGGGSTYITDYHANFYNPANLMIQDREGQVSIGIGIGGFYMDAIRNYSSPSLQLKNARDQYTPYRDQDFSLSDPERLTLLAEEYPRSNTLSDNTYRYDLTLAGVKWRSNNKAYAIAFRSRTSSSSRVGKGWYSDAFQETRSGGNILDRSLTHRYQRLHELSFGYSESFRFLTGLTPRLDNFIIGIAPKLILGGSYQNGSWTNKYEETQNGIQRIQQFTYSATGDFREAANDYMNGTNLMTANDRSFGSDITPISGVGAGLDIGITYLLTLGSDLSAVRPDQQPTQKSLRISFSMTDIGFISYGSRDELSLSFSDTTNGASAPGTISNEAFLGVRGQYIDFIQKFGEDNPFMSATVERGSFSTLLPMALHGGALLEINRLKLMGDISVGLTNNAFNSTKLFSSFGVELRPLSFLPLRGGIRFKAQQAEMVSLGAAIETSKWDLSLAAQFMPGTFSGTPTLVGVSAATLQFHF